MTPTSGKLTTTSSFPYGGIQANLNGQPVRILALGDQEGKSPVYLYSDASGRSAWESISEFTITDSHVLPNAQMNQNQDRNQMAGSGSSNRH